MFDKPIVKQYFEYTCHDFEKKKTTLHYCAKNENKTIDTTLLLPIPSMIPLVVFLNYLIQALYKPMQIVNIISKIKMIDFQQYLIISIKFHTKRHERVSLFHSSACFIIVGAKVVGR